MGVGGISILGLFLLEKSTRQSKTESPLHISQCILFIKAKINFICASIEYMERNVERKCPKVKL